MDFRTYPQLRCIPIRLFYQCFNLVIPLFIDLLIHQLFNVYKLYKEYIINSFLSQADFL